MLTGGDFRFFWPESIKDFASFPSAWDSSLNTGLGQPQLSSLWITSYFNFTALFSKLGLDWNLIQIIFWILPAIFLSFFSSFLLFKFLFNDKKYSLIAGIIYSLNTYFLMILTGGQLGVSLAYSLVPLVFLRFIKILENPNIRNSIFAGLVLSFQILFDPRIFYIILAVILFYSLLNFSKLKIIKNKFSLFAPFIIAVVLNSFWILPLILTKSSALPAGFSSAEDFKFFSFADFSHALSLLHPNFPENIFGKIYFLDPKFLILPLIAFSSLLFKRDKNIIYFSIISLLGIFLAKGTNPPFGEINTWIFENLPGMSMFRDPTKWYTLIAFGYSILIPYSLLNIIRYVQSKTKFTNLVFSGIYAASFAYFLFLIAPVFGQLKVREVPQEYVQLKNFISSQKSFSRILWIPKWQRFGYFSNIHPAIGREELLKGNAGKQISQLDQNLLRDLSVKYIIVPYDSESEIFLNDRKYDSKQYGDAVQKLEKVEWLKGINDFRKMRVFEIASPKDHFWSQSDTLGISYQYISTTEYKIRVQNAKKGDLLVFSEGFDKNWIATSSEFRIQSSEFENLMNSFVLPKNGNYEFEVKYEPQKYVEAGMIMSLASLVVVLAVLKFGNSLKKW